MEARLREDCIAAAAAAKGGGGLPVWYEEGGVNAQKPLDVQADKSFTVRAAYADHVNKQEGTATCEYVRVPIADETAPEEQDFDQLVDELLHHLDPEVRLEERRLVRVASDRDHDFIEHAPPTPQHVEVPQGWRVEGTGVDRLVNARFHEESVLSVLSRRPSRDPLF